MKYTLFNDEVFYSPDSITKVSGTDISFLKSEALKNKRQRVRLCAHPDVDAPLHEMLIVHGQDAYVRPHKHTDKSESFHIIEGAADILIFNERGEITEIIPMGDYASGCAFYYRLNSACYHSMIITSTILVFHETTSGPFRREETLFAPWSPDEKDTIAVANYMNRLKELSRGSA